MTLVELLFFFLGLEQPENWNFTAFFCSLWSLLLLWAWETIPLPVKSSQPRTWKPNCSFLMTWCLWRTRWLRPRRKEASQYLAPQLTEFLHPLWMLKANRGKLLNAPASDKVGGRLLLCVLDTDGLALAPSRFAGQLWGASDQNHSQCVTLQLWCIMWYMCALVHFHYLSLQCCTATSQHSSIRNFPVHFFPLVWTNIQFKITFLIMSLFKAKKCAWGSQAEGQGWVLLRRGWKEGVVEWRFWTERWRTHHKNGQVDSRMRFKTSISFG